MTSRSSGPARRPVAIARCLALACLVAAALATATAHASEYKMVACAAKSGAPPYSLATNSGIFVFENRCDERSAENPPYTNSFLRIAENQPSGRAGYGTYLAASFTPPDSVVLREAGGYTREPSSFNGGWQARFYFSYHDGAAQLQMAQGAGLQGSDPRYFDTSSVFTAHLWPWPAGTDFDRWTFEMICASPAGCDLAGYNAADLTGLVFTLRDLQDSQVKLAEAGSDLLAGRWARGTQHVGWTSFDAGSGLRREELRVDGVKRYVLDYQASGACDIDRRQRVGTHLQALPERPQGARLSARHREPGRRRPRPLGLRPGLRPIPGAERDRLAVLRVPHDPHRQPRPRRAHRPAHPHL